MVNEHELICDGAGGDCRARKPRSHPKQGWRIDPDGHAYCPGCKDFNPPIVPIRAIVVTPEPGKMYHTRWGNVTIIQKDADDTFWAKTNARHDIYFDSLGRASKTQRRHMEKEPAPQYDLICEIDCAYRGEWESCRARVEANKAGKDVVDTEHFSTGLFTTAIAVREAMDPLLDEYCAAVENVYDRIKRVPIYKDDAQRIACQRADVIDRLVSTVTDEEFALLGIS